MNGNITQIAHSESGGRIKMKILRHYCIGKKRIAKFLEKYKVPYSKLYDDDDEYVFDLEEGTEIYQIFKRKFPLQI